MKQTRTLEGSQFPEAKSQSPKKNNPWRLYFLMFMTFSSLIIFNACPSVKQCVYAIGLFIQSFGWLGPILVILLNGLIVIPFALPYPIFEMTMALLIPNFLHAITISMAGKVVGAMVCFLFSRTIMRKRIQTYIDAFNVSRHLEYVLEQEPWKFSFILRVMTLPMFIKNYGLARNISFRIYMTCALITMLPFTALNLFLMRQAGSLSNLFNGSQSHLETIFSIIMITVSIGLFIYVSKYTKKILKRLNEEQPNQIPTYDIELAENETTQATEDNKNDHIEKTLEINENNQHNENTLIVLVAH
jgi:uncharacterized membrane protein YdjX (TVP38/TMEM64 family)